MNFVLICPSNMLFMPYVKNYKNILDSLNIKYDILIWDRFNMEEASEYIYTDLKIGHQRNTVDYLKYSSFVQKIIKKRNYDKIIVFGIQLVFFLKSYLIKNYSENFIVDIRDHNKIINYFNIKRVVEHSSFIVLSSQEYSKWLPKKGKYIINHNSNIRNLEELYEIKNFPPTIKKISIGNIGALRDYEVNIRFIESLKNNEFITVNYHGEGEANKEVIKFVDDNEIKNVNLTGKYIAEEEKNLYLKNDFINVLRYNDGINNQTALPNRLYNAAMYGKPMIALNGTRLADIISEFNLGLVVDTFDNIDIAINKYLKDFDIINYKNKRNSFFKNVIEDNDRFKRQIEEFVSPK